MDELVPGHSRIDSPFFSTIALFKTRLLPLGFSWLPEKKDPWNGNGR